MIGAAVCYECGERCTRCPDCREVYCERCEGDDHDRQHRDAEREWRAYHDDIDRDHGCGRSWRDGDDR